HSNNTVYPWYTNIQPIGWWMASHINEGKEELNFSTFGTYAKERADHKLEEIIEVLDEGTMPLQSYLWMHGDAAVTQEESQLITAWIISLGIIPHGSSPHSFALLWDRSQRSVPALTYCKLL